MDDAVRARLQEWLAERRGRALAFGTFDCATLAADYLAEFHGRTDALGELRGAYRTHAEAMALIERGGGIENCVRARLGAMQPMARCECGWIVVGDFGDGPAIGICAGHNVACVGVRGLTFHALGQGSGCWAP